MDDHEVRWMFHSTAMVPDYDVAIDALARILGLRVLEYSESEVREIGRRGGMTWVGDNSVEIGQPIVAGAGADKFVARTGGGVHSVALQVRDIEAALEHVQSRGVRIAARPGTDFFFTHPHDTCGLFVEWGAIEMHEDPRFGEPAPPFTCPPLLDVTHHAFVGAVVQDPAADAARLADIFGTAVMFDDAGESPGSPTAAVSMGDCALALYDMPGAASESLWGRILDRPRTHVLGFRVDDLDDAAARLVDANVGFVRRDDSQLVIDPTVTGEVAVMVVGQLLANDPRADAAR